LENFDIIIVGAGIGGLKAALAASDNGMRALVLEKLAFVGGDSALSDGTIHATGTKLQQAQGIDAGDDNAYIKERTDPTSSFRSVDFPLTHTLYAGARQMVDELSDQGLAFVPIEDWDIWAHNVEGKGAQLIEFLKTRVAESGIEVRLSVPVSALLVQDDAVGGIKTEDGQELFSKAVLLATGGFAASSSLVAQYTPEFNGVLVVGSVGSSGDGLVMAQNVGAGTVALANGMHTYIVCSENHMDLSYPMGSPSGIFVNVAGKRFIAEDAHYDKAGKACIAQIEHRGYFVFDDAAVKAHPLFDPYFEAQVVTEYQSVEEMSQALSAPDLADTIETYNRMLDEGSDTEFGRAWPLDKLTGPKYYSINGEGCVYFSYGGLDIDTDARVLNTSGVPISGLYACGEVIASPEYREGLIYTSGISCGYVFGAIAITTAAKDMIR
jgi:succinate dehydrogenase/fumarate reductase flavoprotein subunit